jgi:hypothetical protein
MVLHCNECLLSRLSQHTFGVRVCEECGNVAEVTFRAINLRALPGQDTKCKCAVTRFCQDLLAWLSPTLIYVYCIAFVDFYFTHID